MRERIGFNVFHDRAICAFAGSHTVTLNSLIAAVKPNRKGLPICNAAGPEICTLTSIFKARSYSDCTLLTTLPLLRTGVSSNTGLGHYSGGKLLSVLREYKISHYENYLVQVVYQDVSGFLHIR